MPSTHSFPSPLTLGTSTPSVSLQEEMSFLYPFTFPSLSNVSVTKRPSVKLNFGSYVETVDSRDFLISGKGAIVF